MHTRAGQKEVRELYFPTAFYLGLGVTLSTIAAVYFGVGLTKLTVCFFAGILTWSLVEYLFHRFIFHALVEYAKKNSRSRLVTVWYNHELHHNTPTNIEDILTHVQYSLPIASVIGLIILAITQSLTLTLGILPGVFVGYLYYEWVHFACHFWKPKHQPFRWQFQNHTSHHFKDSTRRFGVTNPLWDIVFGTR